MHYICHCLLVIFRSAHLRHVMFHWHTMQYLMQFCFENGWHANSQLKVVFFLRYFTYRSLDLIMKGCTQTINRVLHFLQKTLSLIQNHCVCHWFVVSCRTCLWHVKNMISQIMIVSLRSWISLSSFVDPGIFVFCLEGAHPVQCHDWFRCKSKKKTAFMF